MLEHFVLDAVLKVGWYATHNIYHEYFHSFFTLLAPFGIPAYRYYFSIPPRYNYSLTQWIKYTFCYCVLLLGTRNLVEFLTLGSPVLDSILTLLRVSLAVFWFPITRHGFFGSMHNAWDSIIWGIANSILRILLWANTAVEGQFLGTTAGLRRPDNVAIPDNNTGNNPPAQADDNNNNNGTDPPVQGDVDTTAQDQHVNDATRLPGFDMRMFAITLISVFLMAMLAYMLDSLMVWLLTILIMFAYNFITWQRMNGRALTDLLPGGLYAAFVTVRRIVTRGYGNATWLARVCSFLYFVFVYSNEHLILLVINNVCSAGLVRPLGIRCIIAAVFGLCFARNLLDFDYLAVRGAIAAAVRPFRGLVNLTAVGGKLSGLLILSSSIFVFLVLSDWSLSGWSPIIRGTLGVGICLLVVATLVLYVQAQFIPAIANMDWETKFGPTVALAHWCHHHGLLILNYLPFGRILLALMVLPVVGFTMYTVFSMVFFNPYAILGFTTGYRFHNVELRQAFRPEARPWIAGYEVDALPQFNQAIKAYEFLADPMKNCLYLAIHNTPIMTMASAFLRCRGDPVAVVGPPAEMAAMEVDLYVDEELATETVYIRSDCYDESGIEVSCW